MLSIIIALLLDISFSVTASAQRVEQPLNKDWTFSFDGGEAVNVTLPHTWNAFDAQDSVRDANADKHADTYRRGVGTYINSLEIPSEWKGTRRVFVRFEAACQVATVYINNRIVGEHKGAFTAFCIELTDNLQYGSENELKVEVDNRWRADVPPISGGFAMFGGLYRPAKLIVTDLLCITPTLYGSDGIFIDADTVYSEDQGIIVRTRLNYAKWSYAKMDVRVPKMNVCVRVFIRDADGNTVCQTEQSATCWAGADQEVTCRLVIPGVLRWNGKNSAPLYTAAVSIFNDSDSLVDAKEISFGVRNVELSGEEGFLLNGKPYPVHGVARHQDLRDKGWALNYDDELNDMQLMDEMGVTAIRLAHYPQSEHIHHLADSMGLLVWDEVPLVNDVRNTQAFNDNAYQQAMEMVLQLYNHPSVCWWGLFNEIDFPETPYPYTLFSQLNDLMHKEGGNRLTASASNKGLRYYNGIADAPAWNNYPGWYWMLRWPKEEANKGRVEGFGEWIDYRSNELGGRRFALSEYGAGGNPEHHIEEPLPEQLMETMNAPWHPEEWQCHVHEEVWRTICRHQDQLWGSFIWAMFDFIVPGWGEGGLQNVNTKGLVTHDRYTKKDVFYFYQANWTEKPMLHIASKRMTSRTVADTDIKVYSNCRKVTLRVNHEKIADLTPDDIHVCIFKGIHLQPGNNLIEVTTPEGLHDEMVWKFSL